MVSWPKIYTPSDIEFQRDYLSKGGARRETLEHIIQQFEEQGKAESLNITRLIAGLIFKKQADLEWIERRFVAMHDFLWENSWTYRQSVEQGIEKGLAQGIGKGIRESIERVVQVRFPTLRRLLKKKLAPIQDQEMLLQISVAMSTAENEQAA